jgi:hypothetical protein
MSEKINFIAIMLCAYSCSGNNSSSRIQNDYITTPNNIIRIFRASENDIYFKLIINGKLIYDDSMPNSISNSPGTYIGKIKRGKQDSLKVYLKIDNDDTLFLYNTRGIDSLLLGRKINKKGFYILTNLQKEGWLSE